MFRDIELMILLVVCVGLLYLMLILDTLDRRLTPRIVYVHSSRDDNPRTMEMPEPDRIVEGA